MKVFVSAILNDTEQLATAGGMLRESVEFVLKSLVRQLDNGLVEQLKIDEKTKQAKVEITVQLRSLSREHTGE